MTPPDHDHAAMPEPFPISPDFPVTWKQPDQVGHSWEQESLHWPEPVTVLEFEMIKSIIIDGLTAGGEFYGMPIAFDALQVNTYLYQAVIPEHLAPEEAETRGHATEEKLGAGVRGLQVAWDTEHLPEIKKHLAFWSEFDLAGASTAELLEHLDETHRRGVRLGVIHFLIALPMLLAQSLFDDLYRDVLGTESAFESYELLDGLDNKTLEGGRDLWRVSRIALATPEVRKILEEGPADEAMEVLENSPEAGEFLKELRAHLQEYGQRGHGWLLHTPSFIEDPTPVIKNLKDFIGQPERDLEAEMQERLAERDRNVADARGRLQNHPRAVTEQFEGLLHAAQTANVLSEDHGFWIDFRGFYRIRQVLMEFGLRFAEAGAIEDPGDVFHLNNFEIRETAGALSDGDRRALVAERQGEIAKYGAVTPPTAVGTPPPGPPPDNPMVRALGKFFGGPPPESDDPDILLGAAGSPGTARGVARVITNLADAARLQNGDILVASMTSPPWTPLFITAGGIVTDRGGVLSHAAIVAREYGVPAVVGTGSATARIEDGQMIEVDGDAGEVRLVSD